jgi:hypothetical protein
MRLSCQHGCHMLLCSLQGKMEHLRQSMLTITSTDAEYVAKREKEIEKDRREKYRKDHADAQQAAYAQRLKVHTVVLLMCVLACVLTVDAAVTVAFITELLDC